MTPTTPLFASSRLTLADLPYEARFRRISHLTSPTASEQPTVKHADLYCELCLCHLPSYSGRLPALCDVCLLHFARTPEPLAVRANSVVRPPKRRMLRIADREEARP